MSLLLGIDIGTSAAKALLIDERGTILSTGSAEYPLSQPREGWSEQNPGDWWEGCVKAVRAATAGRGAEIRGIGLSGQMHGSVLLGADARASGGRADALRPALLWNDQRTAKECGDIEALVGGRKRLVEWVGNAALTGFTLPKLLWVRGHEGHVWSKVKAVLLPKDFVRFRMTGEIVTDVGDASGTLLFSPDQRAWSERALAAFSIDPAILPRAMESARVAGLLTEWAAGQMGIAPGVPVVAGSGDNMCGAVGAGVVRPGIVAATLGTSGVIYAHSNRVRKDASDDGASGRLHTMCAATGPEGWCVTGCMLSAGLALRWARDVVAPGMDYTALLAEAEGIAPGCEGLWFLPHLTGERCPYPDPQARGGWVGLTSRHTRAHMIRAVVEGVTFCMGQILDLVRGIGVGVESVRLSGAGNRSVFWRQLQADVYGCPVAVTNTEEGGGALGTALLAGVGANVWGGVEAACDATVKVTETRTPSGQGYATLRARYEQVYPVLRGMFLNGS